VRGPTAVELGARADRDPGGGRGEAGEARRTRSGEPRSRRARQVTGPPVDFIANKHVVDGALKAGVRRVVLVTSIGVGDSETASPWLSRQVLSATLPLKEQAEEYLRASGLDYTIVRPGGLRSELATGNGILTEDRSAFGFIFRRDLARLLVGCLDDPGTISRTFAAIDARRRWPWQDE